MTPSARLPNTFQLHVALQQFCSALGDRMHIQPGQFGKPAIAAVAEAQGLPYDLYFAGTDGWMYLPPTPAIPPYHPDVLAPAPFTTYIFGFRNITGLNKAQISKQKMKAQHQAPQVGRVQAVGVLGGVDALDECHRVEMARQGHLHQDGIHRRA